MRKNVPGSGPRTMRRRFRKRGEKFSYVTCRQDVWKDRESIRRGIVAQAYEALRRRT
jgi:hypothetical protein